MFLVHPLFGGRGLLPLPHPSNMLIDNISSSRDTVPYFFQVLDNLFVDAVPAVGRPGGKFRGGIEDRSTSEGVGYYRFE